MITDSCRVQKKDIKFFLNHKGIKDIKKDIKFFLNHIRHIGHISKNIKFFLIHKGIKDIKKDIKFFLNHKAYLSQPAGLSLSFSFHTSKCNSETLEV